MRCPRLRPAALLLLSCVLLARCAPAPEPVVVRRTVPASLLACAPAPTPPVLSGPRWDEGLANFLLDQGAAGADCRAKLGAVAKLVGAK